jgi:predicted hotdog family 3-hydroxylacyl-ACP dehydratase
MSPALDPAALVPHAPPALVIEAVLAWDGESITCRGRPAALHPFAVEGRLAPLAAAEYGLQAAALHGALLGAGEVRPGRLVLLRALALPPAPLTGAVTARAERLAAGEEGALYRFAVEGDGAPLHGTALIAFVPPAARREREALR